MRPMFMISITRRSVQRCVTDHHVEPVVSGDFSQQNLLGTRWIATLIGVFVAVASTVFGTSSSVHAQENGVTVPDRVGHVIRVDLPIDDQVKRRVIGKLNSIADGAVVIAGKRPAVVLEFDTSNGETGRGSELEACRSLARKLISAEMRQIETIAYIPVSTVPALRIGEREGGGLAGHAVLVAIATNQLAVEKGSSIGDAGADEDRVDEFARNDYKLIAEARYKLPPKVVRAMLDRGQSLERVQRLDKSYDFLSSAESKAAKNLLDADSLTEAGEPLVLTSEQLKEFRMTTLHPESRNDLTRMLKLAQGALEKDVTEDGSWKAVEIPLPFKVDDKAQRWVLNSIAKQNPDDVNMVVITIDESIGELQACLGIAEAIASAKKREIRTVAFVRGKARGPIGLVALACEQMIMGPEAVLGGIDEDLGESLDPKEVEQAADAVKTVAGRCDKDWSLMMKMLNPKLVVERYRRDNSPHPRVLCQEELRSLDDPGSWKTLGPVTMPQGLEPAAAMRLELIKKSVRSGDMSELQAIYQMEEAPEVLVLTASERYLENFAQFLSNPFISLFLIWGTFFFISTEMSAPGLGLPGFLGVICVVLFFWGNWLGGNAEWFEVLMFGVGLLFILLEIFVIPGFGLFGIGGIILMLGSIVLASQKFLIPRTAQDFAQIPFSLLPVLGGAFGILAAGILIPKLIPNSPYLNRMLLQKRNREETGLESGRDPEVIVDWSHLMDVTGKTVTRLSPSGKARLAGKVYDVVSTGQMVDKGQKIVVVEAVGNRVVVQAAEEA